jgi:hypothetical protein
LFPRWTTVVLLPLARGVGGETNRKAANQSA